MGRALGANAKVAGVFETTPGVTPGGGFFTVPIVSHSLGEERPLIASDLLGLGREMQDPISDVATNTGDVVVPVDVRNFGRWLKLFFGQDSVTGATAASGALTFSAQPIAGSTITINGVVFTFVASGPTGNQILIGANLAATLAAAATALNASASAQVALATYTATATTLNIAYDTDGTLGNAFTIAAGGSPASNATASGATLSGGVMATHTFTSGAATLPSMSLEIGAPEVPAYSTHYGLRGNQLKIGLSRSGLLNATCSCIAIGESAAQGTSVAGSPTSLPVTRFAQATGAITKDASALGSVVSADFTFSNTLDPVETIQASGRIEDSDPGMVSMTGSITVRFRDLTLLNAATSGTPCELDFGWTSGSNSLLFRVPRVWLPPTKRPITGPKGVQATFNWQASGPSAPTVTAILVNDVASY